MLDADGSVSTPPRRSATRPCSRRPSCDGRCAGRSVVDRGPAARPRGGVAPARGAGRRTAAGERVVVVGTSTEARDESLTDLAQLLLIGGPVALLLASLAAYGVAAAALRPVEAMRARAAEISAAEPDQRLPVPPTRDEVARLGTTLNEMLERLGEALEHERAFVADASHELRTPLAILRTELELALAEGRSPEELRAALASAAEETDRLTQLSEDLLTIAQTERGELPLRLARVNLAEMLDGVAAGSPAAPRSGAGDRGRARPPRSALDADRLRLDQAVGSMVDNALRYGAGHDRARASTRGDGAVEIHVLDRGGGLPGGVPRPRLRALQPRLVEPPRRRQRTRPGDRPDGRAAHGGDAHAANRAGGGADVWLTLPLSSGVNQGRR